MKCSFCSFCSSIMELGLEKARLHSSFLLIFPIFSFHLSQKPPLLVMGMGRRIGRCSSDGRAVETKAPEMETTPQAPGSSPVGGNKNTWFFLLGIFRGNPVASRNRRESMRTAGSITLEARLITWMGFSWFKSKRACVGVSRALQSLMYAENVRWRNR